MMNKAWPLARARERVLALAVTGVAAAAPALAHDTWFQARPAAHGTTELLLGTGNRFPQFELPVAPASLQLAACQPPTGTAQAPARLQVLRPAHPQAAAPGGAAALRLRVPAAVTRHGPASCWAQTHAHDVVLTPDLVAVYLDEIRASPAVRARWAEQQARGVTWHERYTKHARVELAGSGPRSGPGPVPVANPQRVPQPAPAATPLTLEFVPAGSTLRAGDVLQARLLRDGQPLAGQAVEARSADVGPGFWLRTDAQGWVQLRLPLPGRWLLRTTDLRADPDQADAWVSCFATLALDVAGAPLTVQQMP